MWHVNQHGAGGLEAAGSPPLLLVALPEVKQQQWVKISECYHSWVGGSLQGGNHNTTLHLLPILMCNKHLNGDRDHRPWPGRVTAQQPDWDGSWARGLLAAFPQALIPSGCAGVWGADPSAVASGPGVCKEEPGKHSDKFQSLFLIPEPPLNPCWPFCSLLHTWTAVSTGQ